MKLASTVPEHSPRTDHDIDWRLRRPDFSPVGLTPTEHASLSWTHWFANILIAVRIMSKKALRTDRTVGLATTFTTRLRTH
jgi:hypothetical protein